jgi:hypothetical protein
MLLHRDVNGGGKLVAAHVTEFASMQSAWRWRRSARNHLPTIPGLVFARAMPFIGSGASAGFGGGLPALRRQVLLTAWREATEFESFLAEPLARSLSIEAKISWWSLFEVVSTRGTHLGSSPLSSCETGGNGPFAALTLGRVRLLSLPRFLREGVRLGPLTRNAQGLVSAVSAGWPTTGNCTISIWESEKEMLRFAYANSEGHGDTVRRDPPILLEQLNARLRVCRLGGNVAGGTMLHPERLAQLAATLP